MQELVEWLDATHGVPASFPVHNALFTWCQPEMLLKLLARAIGAICHEAQAITVNAGNSQLTHQVWVLLEVREYFLAEAHDGR